MIYQLGEQSVALSSHLDLLVLLLKVSTLRLHFALSWLALIRMRVLILNASPILIHSPFYPPTHVICLPTAGPRLVLHVRHGGDVFHPPTYYLIYLPYLPTPQKKDEAFDQLRTKQQLGYIVFCSAAGANRHVLSLRLVRM